jgi:hypothetical protein
MGGDLRDDLGIHLNGISLDDFTKKLGVDLSYIKR